MTASVPSNSAVLEIAPILISLVALTLSMIAMRRTREAHEGEIAQEYFSEYGSLQMLQDLKLLGTMRGKINDAFLNEFKEKRTTNPKMIEIDAARRRVKTHYLKPVWLRRRNLISEPLFFTIIDSRGVRLLDNVVGPLTRVTDNLTNPELADFEYIKDISHNLRWISQYRDDSK